MPRQPKPPTAATAKHPTARQQLGARGEQMAAEALIRAGYRIITSDARQASGQIDIVAEEGDTIVFVEVKTRRSTAYGTPAEAITPAKQRHLIAAAQEYLAAHDWLDRPWRIDVVGILLTQGPPQIEIMCNAVGE
jgi:putative endonuclease